MRGLPEHDAAPDGARSAPPSWSRDLVFLEQPEPAERLPHLVEIGVGRRYGGDVAFAINDEGTPVAGHACPDGHNPVIYELELI